MLFSNEYLQLPEITLTISAYKKSMLACISKSSTRKTHSAILIEFWQKEIISEYVLKIITH